MWNINSNTCKWSDKCWNVQNIARSVDGRCCGDAPSSSSVQWVGDVRSLKKRKTKIPEDNDDDDQPPPVATFSDYYGSHTTDLTDASQDLPYNSIPWTFTITNTSTGVYDHAIWTVPSHTTVVTNNSTTFVGTWHPPIGPITLTFELKLYDAANNLLDTRRVAYPRNIEPPTFVWCDPPVVADPFNATGTINGVQYVYTSSQPVITSPDIINYDRFPSYFNIPNEGSIRNNDNTDNVLTFAQPVLNPIIVIASIGTNSFVPGITVTIDFDHDFTALWSENVVINSSNSLSGHEGYVVLAFTGTISSISFHLTAESYMDLIFGAYF